jgi:ubiquinone/menaquinone biosynthesis C-methylase UbiE
MIPAAVPVPKKPNFSRFLSWPGEEDLLTPEYDGLADDYDSTREIPKDDEVRAISEALEGSKTVLDVGIGTGRFAKPLSDRGFEVTGVDVSRNMLLKARGKGLDRLVLGDAYRLPFRDESFDAAVIIHVLHVVVNWSAVMRGIGRVTRGNVVSIFRQRPDSRPWTQRDAPAPPQQEGGYPVRTQHRMWQNEQELLQRVPPIKVVRIRDETVSMTAEEAIRKAQSKGPVTRNMPPEFQRQMFERIIAMKGDQQVHRRIVDDLIVWSAEELRSLGP